MLETMKLRLQLSVLKDVVKEYKGRTIDNIITNLEERVKARERYESDE